MSSSDSAQFPHLPSLASLAAFGALEAPAIVRLAQDLARYNKMPAAIAVAGMLTCPRLQANCYRLELLQQLIILNSRGEIAPTASQFFDWINGELGEIAYMEDPPEDVFVMNIVSQKGSFRVLGGLWEIPDAAANLLIKAVESYGGDTQLAWLRPVHALLRLSDLVLERALLNRWDTEPSEAKIDLTPVPESEIAAWGKRVEFTREDLVNNNIDPTLLERFVFTDADLAVSDDITEQCPYLFAKPLLRFGDTLVLALPTAVTYAARRAVIDQAIADGQLDGLQSALMSKVVKHVMRIMSSSNHDVEPLSLPPAVRGKPGSFQSFAFRVGRLRIVHLLIVKDPLEQFANACIYAPSCLDDEEEKALNRHVADMREYIESLGDFDFGYTIPLLGHLGQGFALTPPNHRQKWIYEATRLNFLEFILQNSDAPLDRLILLLTQRATMEATGLHLPNYNGLLNLYAFWIDNGHTLRIAEMAHDQHGYLQIATDYVLQFRLARRQAIDMHCEVTVGGAPAVVVRANSDSIYESMQAVPAYLNISNLTSQRESFCIRSAGTVVWITLLTRTNDKHHHMMMHELWEGLQLLVYRALENHNPSLRFHAPAIEIVLDFMRVMPSAQARENDAPGDDLELLEHRELPVVCVRAEPGFLGRFGGVTNTGEQLLVSRIISALRLLANFVDYSASSCDHEALMVLGGVDAKILHAFAATGPVEYLLASDTRRVFRLPAEYVDASIRTAFTWMPAHKDALVLDRTTSCETLNATVAHLLKQIVARLARFDRTALVADLLHAHETLLRDQQRWRATARAVRALYGVKAGTDAAHSSERERSQAKLTLRALAEAAVCECIVSDGIAPDGHAIDELFGLMWSLLQIGRDSETIYHGLSSEGITIHPSGAYSFTADILDEVGGRFTIESFRTNFEASAADYEKWVVPQQPAAANPTRDTIESTEFQQAFLAEFGLSSDAFIEICSSLLDTAIEQAAVVVRLSRHALVESCKNRGVTEANIDCFLTAFSLSARPTWAPQRPLAEPRDVQPWRFERRLSLMLRPLVECTGASGTLYVYGAATLQQSSAYVLDSIARGKFDKDVFRSTQMRSYIGRRVDTLGAAFTQRVAMALASMGWQTRTEVKMSALVLQL